ncbi:hypothetical protein TrVFT333_005275 [Trichoderma virens FT-333]|nr:hypothetical protein TrVFT333_005275 [Trichoderma virens FT-333]
MDSPRGPLILHFALIRTGTASMAKAYEILGYKNVYHGLTMLDRNQDWVLLEKAADATYPQVLNPGKKPPPPWTRSDWDRLFGECDAVTDIGSFFSLQLLEAYPDAKVVLVERDYDNGVRSGDTVRKMMLGFFNARDIDQLRKNAKERYFEHYRQIRELVPPERLLEYKLSDGWGPLCQFLDREEPSVDFPRTNETKEIRKVAWARLWKYTRMAGIIVGKYAVGIMVLGAAAWFAGGYGADSLSYIHKYINQGPEEYRS